MRTLSYVVDELELVEDEEPMFGQLTLDPPECPVYIDEVVVEFVAAKDANPRDTKVATATIVSTVARTTALLLGWKRPL